MIAVYRRHDMASLRILEASVYIGHFIYAILTLSVYLARMPLLIALFRYTYAKIYFCLRWKYNISGAARMADAGRDFTTT